MYNVVHLSLRTRIHLYAQWLLIIFGTHWVGPKALTEEHYGMVCFISVIRSRVLWNQLFPIASVDDYEKGEDMDLLKQKYAESVERGETDRILVWAGSAVGLMDQVKPAWVCSIDRHLLS
jgi:hypothetical protein